ncbi:hypothetical protein HanXRQr2_Chr06g0239871 [Helianthus annuus]|uniref:Uncharacterized protein n=1 Tax=Helianthus annuus TaxID=4232 RepID=A0A9K3IPK8_HELAN|nr:hypothetical protein HanXRQr2_Chr06g0239871 [Helianthus annuus]
MVWLKTFKLSALGRQPEDVEYCICYYVLILVDAMIQVWGCLATSPLRYQRIQEELTYLSDHLRCITTNTADLLIRSCSISFCTCVFIFMFKFMVGRTGGVLICLVYGL